MTITYLYPSLHYPGGISRVLTLKMNYLADVLGYTITLITYSQFDKGIFFPLSPNIKMINLDLRRNTLFEGSYLSKKQQERRFLADYRKQLEAFLQQHPQDIVISTTFGLEYKFLYRLKDKSKKIGEYHFSYPQSPLGRLKTIRQVRHPKDLLDLLARRAYIKCLNGLDRFILLTQRDQANWQPTLHNTHVLPNPITLKSEQTSTCTPKTVLAIGRLHYQKSFDQLIEAWRLVHAQNPDWTLKIVGNGEEEAKIRNLIKTYQLEDVVSIVPPSIDVHQDYLNSSIYAMTSKAEGLPLVLIEAMHFGLPLVSYDCECGPSDLIEEGINGYLVPLGDYRLLAQRINHLIENPELRLKQGQAGRQRSFNYSIEAIMSQWLSLFNDLLSK